MEGDACIEYSNELVVFLKSQVDRQEYVICSWLFSICMCEVITFPHGTIMEKDSAMEWVVNLTLTSS